MKAFTTHTGLVAAMDRSNVDTDQIIPKQFTKEDIVTLTRMLLSDSSHMLSGQIFNVGGI